MAGIEEMEKKITCDICHGIFVDPKVLPCCHYYCKLCIHRLTLRLGVDKPISCPMCSKTTILPDGGVDSLPTAFFIDRMKAMHFNMERAHGKVEARCEMCSGGKVGAFCWQCTMFMCAECVKQHHKLKIFTGHKTACLEELKDFRAEDMVAKPTLHTCKVHEEPLNVYCVDCNKPVCHDCRAKDHHSHACKSIKAVAKDAKARLIRQLDLLKQEKEGLTHSVENIETTDSEVEVQGQNVTRNIEKTFDTLHSVIEQHKRSLLEDAAAKVTRKREHLSAQKKNLLASCAVVQSVIDYTEHCVQHSAYDELMSMHKELQSKLAQEIKEQKNNIVEPVEEPDMGLDVVCADKLKQLLQTNANLAQLDINCSVTIQSAVVNKISEFHVTTKLSDGFPTKQLRKVTCRLRCIAYDSFTECEVDAITWNKYRVQSMPTHRGHHELTVIVNGQEVANSPFAIFVSVHPTQLGKPLRVFVGLKEPNGVGVLSTGEIVVSEAYGDIVTLNKQGKKMRSIKYSDYDFEVPRGLAVDCDDNIYFIDQGIKNIYKSDRPMRNVFSRVAQSSGHYAIAAIGSEVLVCGRENKGNIEVYNKKLNYVASITPKGTGCGKTVALSSDKYGNIFVADITQECIHVMSRSGDILRSLGGDEQGKKMLENPTGVCVSGQFVYVSDWNNHNITIFTTEGKYVTSFGQFGAKKGQFNKPTGLCFDKDGFLYVCDFSNCRVQIF